MYNEKVPTMGSGSVLTMQQVPPPNKPQDPGLAREIEITRANISGLGKSVEELRVRLNPVLRPSQPETNGQNVGLAPSVNSPAADCLVSLRNEISGIRELVEDIHRRLDV
jgi:hypothetical protein